MLSTRWFQILSAVFAIAIGARFVGSGAAVLYADTVVLGVGAMLLLFAGTRRERDRRWEIGLAIFFLAGALRAGLMLWGLGVHEANRIALLVGAVAVTFVVVRSRSNRAG